MVAFAEVISFLGAASLFAWLAFVALQNDQLDQYSAESLKKEARFRLFTVYDFFLISFVCYVIAYVADYLVHFQNATILIGFDTYSSPILYGVIDAFCIVGFLTLLLPMGYIRSMSKGATTPLTVNPPDFPNTLVRIVFGVMNFSSAMSEFTSIQGNVKWQPLLVWHVFWFGMILVSGFGFLASLRDWNTGWKRILRDGLIMFLPLFASVIFDYILFPYCNLLHVFDNFPYPPQLGCGL